MTRSSPSGTAARVKALDKFAGTGWGVACKRLGIREVGVEIMPEAVETRTANGMETIYRDVWDGITLTAEQHSKQYGSYGLSIASPPCQTFSMSGKGAGRAALNEVMEAIELHAYKDAAALRAFGEKHDMRTALVLAPLAYVWRDRPRLVAFEQVPTVLPVWEACAEVMRGWGYDVKVEVLNAEQYGVPQTRKRAILVARRGGPVHLPVPTHSRYYQRDPQRLDPGVLPWVSMADALGWGFTERPSPTITGGGGKASGIELWDIQTRKGALAGIDGGTFITHNRVVNPKTPLDRIRMPPEEAATLQTYPPFPRRGLTDRPAPTITGGGTETGGAEPIAKFHERYTSSPGWTGSTERLSVAEAARLQSYPEGFQWTGSKSKQFLQIGNAVPPLLAEAVLAALLGLVPGR